MKEVNLISIKQAAQLLNVSANTLRNWEASGKINSYRTAGNHRRYDKSELMNLVSQFERPIVKHKITVGYARVSTPSQKEDLERQEKVLTNFCEANGYIFKIIKDIGSGINYNKKGLQELIDLICNGRVGRVVLNYKDRLIRFGYELIEQICEIHNVEIVILNQTEDLSFEQELVEDVLSIITVYSAKLYGTRSHKNKKIIEANKKLFQLDDENEEN